MLRRCCFPMGPFVAQGLAALIANLMMFSVGMIFGWSSPSLPKLLQGSRNGSYTGSELQISPDEGSWVVSLISFGAIFGPILLNLLVDRIGRKWSLNLVTLPILISWLVIGLATSVETLYVGRFIGGFSLGAVYALMPMYLGEIAEDSIRGALGTIMSTVINLGMLMSFCVGPWLSRQTLSVISSLPPIIFIILSPWMPETPYFLLMRGCREKAMSSLIWLRRREDVKEELASLERIVIEEEKNRDGFGIRKLLDTSVNRRAFCISLCLVSFQQFSGVLVIQSYASLIFEDSGFTGWSSYSVIIMGVVKLIAGISVMFLIDVAGRRPILIVSALFTGFFLTSEGVFFHLKHLRVDTSSYSWIPLLAIIGFYFSYIPGLGSVPYAMIGELFATNVKAPATMLLAMYGSALGLLITKVYQTLLDAIGVHWIFYIFAILTLANVPIVYFFIPETKKLSLEDIQENLRSNPPNEANDSNSPQADSSKQ